jgi:serine/threonine-protein kinase
MTTSKAWIAPYVLVILLVLSTGPLLAAFPLFSQSFVRQLGISAAQALRLAADVIGLLVLCLIVRRTHRKLCDTGKGLTFLRRQLYPMTAFFIMIAGHKVYELHAMPIFGSPPQPLYNGTFTLGLLGAALWATVTCLRHSGVLIRALTAPASQRRRSAPPALPSGISQPPPPVAARPAHPPVDSTVPSRNGQAAPTTLGRYQIVKEVGRGAMGVVYLGKDPTLQRSVAIKTMRLDELDNMEEVKRFRERFICEAESTGRLSHPNIVTIYDAGEQEGLAFIAMEYLQGISLSNYCQKTVLLPAKQVLYIVGTVADALDYAHSQGVVHRDIKPANIMLMKNRIVKVMDFGIAKLASSSKTQTSMILGTPRYMSPEQALGNSVDGRSDVFSLGIVLFELLTGEKPFDAENMPALVMRLVKAPHPPLNKYRRDLPSRVQTILDRALHKDLTNRYRHAGDMAQDLRELSQVMPR